MLPVLNDLNKYGRGRSKQREEVIGAARGAEKLALSVVTSSEKGISVERGDRKHSRWRHLTGLCAQ